MSPRQRVTSGCKSLEPPRFDDISPNIKPAVRLACFAWVGNCNLVSTGTYHSSAWSQLKHEKERVIKIGLEKLCIQRLPQNGSKNEFRIYKSLNRFLLMVHTCGNPYTWIKCYQPYSSTWKETCSCFHFVTVPFNKNAVT